MEYGRDYNFCPLFRILHHLMDSVVYKDMIQFDSFLASLFRKARSFSEHSPCESRSGTWGSCAMCLKRRSI
jgi:hypothetical protein